MANLSFGSGGSSYFDVARQQQVFSALALITTPVVYTTAAATGGPLLWNNSQASGIGRVLAVILGVSIGVTTAAAAAATMGITGNSGQPNAPTSTTAIDAVANTYVGKSLPQCNLYRLGTVANAGNFFIPTHEIPAALTSQPLGADYVDIGGSIVVPPGSWVALAAGSTATSAVCQASLIWAEIPF